MAILRQPLFQFLLLGAVIFALYGLFETADGDDGLIEGAGSHGDIVVDRAYVKAISDAWKAKRSRPPTQRELSGELANRVTQQRLFRAGVERGLDENDIIIQRRVAQKMRFLAADLAGVSEVTEAELKAAFDADPKRFAPAERVTFRQRLFKGEGAERRALDVAEKVAEEGLAFQAVVGDPTMLPPGGDSEDRGTIASAFGAHFADTVLGSKDRVIGPLKSEYGWHLVEVTARTGDTAATFEAARRIVKRELLHARRKAAEAAFDADLKARYPVRYDGIDPTALGLGAL